MMNFSKGIFSSRVFAILSLLTFSSSVYASIPQAGGCSTKILFKTVPDLNNTSISSHSVLQQFTKQFGESQSLYPSRMVSKVAERQRSIIKSKLKEKQHNWSSGLIESEVLNHIQILTPSTELDCKSILKALRNSPSIEYALPKPSYNTWQSVPRVNDEFFSQQWSLDAMAIDVAWEKSMGEDVVVAVLDTGIDINHPDLADNIYKIPGEIPENGIDDDGNGYIDDVYGWNFNTQSNDVSDNNGHGTAVAGIIGAVSNNASGIAGVSPSVKILPSVGFTIAVPYAVANGADVINLSGGIEKGQLSEEDFSARILFEKDILSAAEASGVTVIKAAGNSSSSIEQALPPKVPYGITVSAMEKSYDESEQQFIENKYEPASYSNFGYGVDVTAPAGDNYSDFYGRGVLTSGPSSLDLFQSITGSDNGTYYHFIGTSAAAPHVTGLAAILKSLNPQWSPENIRQALRQSAVSVYENEINYYGKGLVSGSVVDFSSVGESRITNPMTGDVVQQILSIQGVANSQDFKSWYLKIQSADQQILFEETSDKASHNSEELAQLDTLQLAEGKATLSLEVEDDSGITFDDVISILVDDISFSLNAPYRVKTGDSLNTSIAISEGNTTYPFEYFEIVATKVDDSATSEITLIREESFPSGGRKLLDIDTSSLSSGEYQLQLKVQYKNSLKIESQKIVVDDTLLWSKKLDASPYALHVADLNSDGTNEIVFVTSGTFSTPSMIYVADYQGHILPGWPVELFSSSNNFALADIDNDEQLDVVITGASTSLDATPSLFAFDVNAEILTGFPKSIGGGFHNTYVAVEDISHSSNKEIIVLGNQNDSLQARVHVFSNAGDIVDGWPVDLTLSEDASFGGEYGYSMAIADLDFDGLYEIYVKSGLWKTESKVWALDHSGEIKAGFPASLYENDNSSTIPVYISAYVEPNDENTGIYLSSFYINSHGVVTDISSQSSELDASFSVALADINNDKQPERIMFVRDGFLPELDAFYKQHFDITTFFASQNLVSTTLSGDVLGTSSNSPLSVNYNVFHTENLTPVVADLDNDEEVEFIVSGKDIQVWREDGSLWNNFQREGCDVEDSFPFRLQVHDLTGDKHPEIIAYGCGNVTVWSFQSEELGKVQWNSVNVNTANTGTFQNSSSQTNFVMFDYDGDSIADITVRRPSAGYQFIKRSSDGEIERTFFGANATDVPISGDFDGDKIADIAIFRSSEGNWIVRNSSNGNISRFYFGDKPGDIPIPADYDGDGITDLGIYRNSNNEGTWIIRPSSDESNYRYFVFGNRTGDIPVPADYDGDGKADIAIRRPEYGQWILRKSSSPNQIERISFGSEKDDIAVPGDYDGDGIDDVAVRRPNVGMWFIRYSSNNEIYRLFFGAKASDIPAPADYDGDGKTDLAFRRPAVGQIIVAESGDNFRFVRMAFGNSTDIAHAYPVEERMKVVNLQNSTTFDGKSDTQIDFTLIKERYVKLEQLNQQEHKEIFKIEITNLKDD